MDLLAREDAPLSAEDWESLDRLVVEVGRKYLVGRRFIPVFGPLGAGVPVVPSPELVGFGAGEAISSPNTPLTHLARLQKDFVLKYEDIETTQRLGLPVDLAAAAAAAYVVAGQEDDLIFNGSKEYGAGGLTNAKGIQKVKAGTWSDAGGFFADLVKALDALASAGFPGPYAVAAAPSVWALTHRPLAPAPTLESDMIADVAQVGYFSAPALNPKQAVVLEAGSLNMDLAVAMDFTTAYLGPDHLDQPFRVMETVALRIKRPQAIVVIA
jgi:uncharacterized linocin/CFP29 family protein